MVSTSNDSSLSLNQDTNQFLEYVLCKEKLGTKVFIVC